LANGIQNHWAFQVGLEPKVRLRQEQVHQQCLLQGIDDEPTDSEGKKFGGKENKIARK
jgi:hypothetical protein